jgi:hypothetical protein
MSAEAAYSPPVKSHAGWKLDMLEAMAIDRRMRRVDVAIAVLVIQRSRQQSRVSAITDDRLAKQMKCNRATFTEFRKRGVAAGYFDCIPGASGRATTYRWKNDRLDQIRNIELDQRIIDSEKGEDGEQESEDNDEVQVHRKLSTRAVSSAKKTKRSNDSRVPRKLSTTTGDRAQKTKHYPSAERIEHNLPKCAENSAYSAEKTKHLHSFSTLRDSLPEKNRTLEAYEALVFSECDAWTHEDWQARFNEVAGFLEFDEGLPRPEAEDRARILCGFDEADAVGRQSARDTLPTVAKCNLEEGTSDDQEHLYHDL